MFKCLRIMILTYLPLLANNSGMAGLRLDQIEGYQKDMYKYERIGETMQDPKYSKIYKVKSGATGMGDKFTQKLSAGRLAQHTAEGQTIVFKSPVSGWTSQVAYKTYSDGLTFTYEAVKDAIKMKNMIQDFANTWGDEVIRAKETWASRAFNNGGVLLGDKVFNGSFDGDADASGKLLYDSEPLFNLSGNTNTTKGGGTYYNSVSTAYPSSGSILPSHIKTLYNLMTATNNRDELDRPTMNKPDTIVCKPGSDHDDVLTNLQSDKLAGSQLNDKNIYAGRIANIIPWDYITESAIYMGKANSDLMTFDERQAPEIDFFEHKPTKGYMASILTRFGTHFKPRSRALWVRGGGTSA